MNLKPAQIAFGIVVGALVAGGGYAIAATRSTVIHGCVSKKTHALTVTSKCGKGTTALEWNQRGVAGAKGAAGAAGAVGAEGPIGPQGQPGSNGSNGTSSGPIAYGQVWMGSSAAELAPSSGQNIVGVGSAGVGGAVVDVQGCSSAGLAEPTINVTADKDSRDTLTGANNTANVADAYISGWSTEPDTSVLVVAVDTTNPVNGLAVDSDFSISVIC